MQEEKVKERQKQFMLISMEIVKMFEFHGLNTIEILLLLDSLMEVGIKSLKDMGEPDFIKAMEINIAKDGVITIKPKPVEQEEVKEKEEEGIILKP